MGKKRLYEIPYTFNTDLLKGLKLLQYPSDLIYSFYMCPYQDDYFGIIKGKSEMNSAKDRKDYERQIEQLNEYCPNSLQLLLQRPNKGYVLSNQDIIKYYINLGFNKFCCGSIEQAKIIKDIIPNAEIIGSITMQIDKKQIELNHAVYKQYLNKIVLPFKYGRNLSEIKLLPKDFEYILLVNSHCNSKCDGIHHWISTDLSDEIICPGKFPKTIPFEEGCMIRPMDLYLFDPYISIYKLQDRSYPTCQILHDIILYSTNYYDAFPKDNYTESFYNNF